VPFQPQEVEEELLVPRQTFRDELVGVSIINIKTPTPSAVGRRREALVRSDLLNLLITPICFKVYELRRRFPTAKMHTDPILSPTTSQFPNQLAKNKEAMVTHSEVIDPSTLENLE
jgi:hypothetical protein